MLVTEDLKNNGVSLPLSENTDVLGQTLQVGAYTVPNRLAIHNRISIVLTHIKQQRQEQKKFYLTFSKAW